MSHPHLSHRIPLQPFDSAVSGFCSHCPLLSEKVSLIRIDEDRMPSIRDTKGQRQVIEKTAVVSVTGNRIPLGVPHPMHPLELSVRRRTGERAHTARFPKETANICASVESRGGGSRLPSHSVVSSIFLRVRPPDHKLFPLRGRTLGPKSLLSGRPLSPLENGKNNMFIGDSPRSKDSPLA
jgi:hypothetical protein